MIEDREVLYDMFKNDQLDMLDVRGKYIKKAKDDGYYVKKYLDGVTEYIEFNMDSDILKNKNIRKAIACVIDKHELCSTVLKDEYQEAKILTNPVVKNGKDITYKKSTLSHEKSIKRARELFEEGLKEIGVYGDINLKMLINDSEDSRERAMYYIDSIEENLGIEVELEAVTFKEKLVRHKNCDFDVEVVCIAPDYNSPITYLDMLGGNNSQTYINSEYDDLLESAKEQLNDKKRVAIFNKLENIIINDVPVYPLYYRNVHYLVKNNLKDVLRGPFENFNMYYAHY